MGNAPGIVRPGDVGPACGPRAPIGMHLFQREELRHTLIRNRGGPSESHSFDVLIVDTEIAMNAYLQRMAV